MQQFNSQGRAQRVGSTESPRTEWTGMSPGVAATLDPQLCAAMRAKMEKADNTM